MSEKTIKLRFRKVKGHLNHLDDWNHFTQDGQVGEYPEEIGRIKLHEFPNSFEEYIEKKVPEKKAKKMPDNPIPDKPEEEEKAVEEAPDKALKGADTKKK